jgi:hypothetical protein
MIIFLGSGVSLPTGLPDVRKLTEAVLTGDWHKHTDQLFYRGRVTDQIMADPTSAIQRFLRFLKGLADAGFAKERREAAIYEDLFFICNQLVEHEDGMGRNVSILPFLDSIRAGLSQFPINQGHIGGFHSHLHALAGMACTLIQSVVRIELHTNREPVGLDLVVELAKQPATTVVSLNHDLLVERKFQIASLPYHDGFGTPDGEVRWFDDKLLEPSDLPRLLKPHGSIDRYYFFPSNGLSGASGIGIPTHTDPDHCRNASGELLCNNGIPQFLTGVGNKVDSYNSGVFAETMFRFHETLKRENQIVMSGYGWADRGINVRLLDWLFGDRTRKIYLLHENPEEFLERLSPLTYRREGLIARGQLIEVRKWLCDTTVEDLVAAAPDCYRSPPPGTISSLP